MIQPKTGFANLVAGKPLYKTSNVVLRVDLDEIIELNCSPPLLILCNNYLTDPLGKKSVSF